jgi:ribonuclease P protein component
VVVHQRRELREQPPLVGFVVSKSVGGSVVRHQVARRLRAQVALRLSALPAGSGTVVRALPDAAEASSTELGAALDQALARLDRRG